MGDSERSRSMCCRQDDKIMKFSYSSNFFNSLTESLLVEILARLPSRAAIRLKLVCKRWCSLISSDYFITFFNHRRHDPSLPPIHDHDSPSFSLVFQFAYSNYSGEYDYCSSLVRCGYTHRAPKLYGHHRLDLSFLPCPQSKIELNASCADLILCSFKKHPLSRTTFYYVCNLLTKQWVALPPAFHFKEHAIGFLCVHVPAPCSLCHHHQGYARRSGNQCVENSDYKFMVVQIRTHKHDLPLSQFKVHLFSSEEGQWRTRVVSSPRTLNISRSNSCYGACPGKSYNFLVPYKGMLHWLTSDCVVVFDPYNAPERFSRVIDLPLESLSHYTCSIGVCRDRLRVGLFYSFEGSSYDIWELEDYNMGKWSLVHKLYARNLNFVPENLLTERGILYFHPDGNVVYERKNFSIWLCNSQSGMIDHQYELIHCGAHELDIDRGNVLQIADQWWPTPVPSLPLNMQPCKIENNGDTLGNLKEEGEG